MKKRPSRWIESTSLGFNVEAQHVMYMWPRGKARPRFCFRPPINKSVFVLYLDEKRYVYTITSDGAGQAGGGPIIIVVICSN